MRIYTTCMGEDIGNIGSHYVLLERDVPQLVIDHYWGTLTKPKPGRLTVSYDSTRGVARLHDANLGQEYEYNILYFDLKLPQIP